MKGTGWLARGKNARRALEGALVGLAIGIAIAFIGSRGWFDAYESRTVDARMNAYADPENVAKDLIVLEIDEETIRFKESEGVDFPFDRQVWANLIAMLDSLEPRAIVFDVTFGDRRESATRPVFDESFSSSNVALGDNAWRSGRVVVGVSTVSQRKDASPADITALTGRRPELEGYFTARVPPTRIAPDAAVPEKAPLDAHSTWRIIFPEEFILAGVRGLGFVDTAHVQDADGALRRFAPLARVAGEAVPDLSIAALVVGLASTSGIPIWMHPDPPAPDALDPLPAIEQSRFLARLPGGREVPLREDGTAWIRWRGQWGSNPDLRNQTFGAKYLMSNTALQQWEEWGRIAEDPADQAAYEELFRGKIVLVGLTIQGEASDFTQTPFGPQPGVFRYASTLDTILTGDYLRSPTRAADHGLAISVALLTGLAGFASADALRRRSHRPTLIGSGALLPGLAILAAYVVGSRALFDAGWIVNQIPSMLGIVSVTLVCAVTSFALAQRESLEESKKKEHFLGLARQGLGSAVVDELLERGPDAIPEPGGKRYALTLYFSDIAGFTTISEKLEPIQLVQVLNEYLARVTSLLVKKHHGFLDKYIGDAVMVFWGAPIPAPDGAVKACMAALDALQFIEQYSAELVARGLPPLKTRIGLNTGPAVAAYIGLPGERFYYTALGDTVNLASRLEGANKAYGTSIMIGPQTYDEAKHAVLARELDLVRVKGKHIPVHVYELIGRIEDPFPREREIKRRYEAALAKFRAREFEAAKADFQALIDEHDDPPSRTYLKYCEERLREPPPPDWDGSNELHDK